MDQNQIKAGGASINISINSDSVNSSLQLIQKNIKNFVSEAHKTGKIDFSIDPGSAREQLKNILSSLRRFRTEGKESIDSAVESFRELNKKAGSLCDTLEGRLSKSFNILKTFSLSLIAYLGPFSKFGDNFNKMAGRTGAGTEFLSEMGHAASLCGANLEALEQAFKKMSQDFVAGQNGNKEVIDSYNKLGLSFEYIAALSPEQRFDALRKAIRGIRDPAEQAGIAQNSVKNKNLKNPLFTASRLRERIFSFF